MNMVLLEAYEKDDIEKIKILEEFSKKTFPEDGTENIFIACALILLNSTFRLNITLNNLANILKCGKNKINNKETYLEYYYTKMNTNKLFSKYLKKSLKDPNLEKHINLILEYINDRNLDFQSKIEEFYHNHQ